MGLVVGKKSAIGGAARAILSRRGRIRHGPDPWVVRDGGCVDDPGAGSRSSGGFRVPRGTGFVSRGSLDLAPLRFVPRPGLPARLLFDAGRWQVPRRSEPRLSFRSAWPGIVPLEGIARDFGSFRSGGSARLSSAYRSGCQEVGSDRFVSPAAGDRDHLYHCIQAAISPSNQDRAKQNPMAAVPR